MTDEELALAKLKLATFERDEHRCRLCNRPAEVAHHRYYPELFEKDSLDNLTSLCNRCHHQYHNPFHAVTALSEVREEVQASMSSGITCPVCNIRSKIYKRSFNKRYVKALLLLVSISRSKADEEGWFKIGQDDLGKVVCHDLNHLEYSKLRYWELIEKRTGGHNRQPCAGMWRITSSGYLFLQGGLRVPAFVWECRKQALRKSENEIDIHSAWGQRFDFDEEILG